MSDATREPGRIRAATFHDLDRVAALWTAITAHHEPLDPVFEMRADAGPALMELLRALHRSPDAAIFVYTVPRDGGEDMPGMIIVRIDHAPPIMREQERAEITDLGVRADARRQGIARRLVAEALRWVQDMGVHRVEVQVARANPEGQAFWRSQGFGDLMDVLQRRL